jgi:hypothetical protein
MRSRFQRLALIVRPKLSHDEQVDRLPEAIPCLTPFRRPAVDAMRGSPCHCHTQTRRCSERLERDRFCIGETESRKR